MLSRQNLRPSLKDEWVRKLNDAIQFVKANDFELISSVGSPNWEIITACALLSDIKVKIIVPVSANANEKQIAATLKAEFPITGRVLETELLYSKSSRRLTEEDLKMRDQIIINRADLLIPISIRPNGNMHQLLQVMQKAGKNLNRDFSIKYKKKTEKLSYTIDSNLLSEEIKQLKKDYIFHWTRSSNNPWPNESKLDFYKDILNSKVYPRSAMTTLKRIAGSNLIIGSSKNIPAQTKAVSFSGLTPANTIKLMRWRARYRQMTFEPYGIGIDKSTALEVGIKPVTYYESSSELPNSIEPYLTQSSGRKTDWRNEEEFRIQGNCDFSKIPNERLLLVTCNKDEAVKLQSLTGIKSVWFID